jgi:hypothetical protein
MVPLKIPFVLKEEAWANSFSEVSGISDNTDSPSSGNKPQFL